MQDVLIGEIADVILRAKPSDRGAFIACIEQQLGDTLREKIDSHNTNSVVFVIAREESQLLLKAEFGSNTATHKEVDWYKRLGTMGLGQKGFFLGSVRSDTFALLALHYIEGAITLDEWALQHPSRHADFERWVLLMLEYDRSLFAATARTASKDTVEQSLTSKYYARRKEAAAIPYLDSLFANRQVTINAHVFLTPDYAFEKLLSSEYLREKLMPKSVGFIHGDLHAGNALIKNKTLHYVDPNGNFELPLEYDIAKMLHSIHGQFPVIMNGAFEVIEESKGCYSFDLKQQPIYAAAHQKLKSALDQDEYVRSVFIEAMHFATMLPHHAQNQLETTALFLRSAQLFGELFELLD